MIKKRSAKHTFIASIVSMVLCLTMLIGTSLAWFTDTATNNDNKIAIGTLGVELRMGTDKVDAEGNPTYEYVNIADEDNTEKKYIFSEATDGKWEPGKTEVVFLQVANVAELALNYNIILEVAAQNLKEGAAKADISQVMKYAIIPGANKEAYENAMATQAGNGVTGWEAICAIAKAAESDTTTGLLGSVKEGATLAAPKGALEKEESDYFVLAVHMNQEAGNDYQNHEITVNVKVDAKQMVSESDYFGNTYDEDAEFYQEPIVDMLTNGGAEEELKGWGYSNAKLSATNEQAHAGSNSFKLVSNEGKKGTMYQTITVAKGQKIRVSGYVYTNTTVNQLASIYVDGTQSKYAGVTLETGAESGWYEFSREYTVNNTASAEETCAVKVEFRTATGGTLYFDNLSVTIVE